jgi:DNA-binding transcriptional LysR family regulator
MAPAKRREAKPYVEPKRLKLDWVETFVTLADCQSYTETAKQIGRDQGTVSRHLGQLQAWLRRDLIASYQPVTLTDAGTEFLKVARNLLEKLESSRAPLPPPRSPRVASAKDIDMSSWTNRDGTGESD